MDVDMESALICNVIVTIFPLKHVEKLPNRREVMPTKIEPMKQPRIHEDIRTALVSNHLRANKYHCAITTLDIFAHSYN